MTPAVISNPMSVSNPMSTPDPALGRVRVSNGRHGGFTLIEVLVSVLVISIGLLGVARLVLAAVKANDSAYFRGQAAALAYSILDDMRANRAYALTSPGYTVAYGTYANPGVTCNGGTACTPAQIAEYDLYMWKQQLSAASTVTSGALPSGDGQIVMNFPGGSGQVTATITVTWDDSIARWAFGSPQSATPSLQTFTLESGL
jgi:type IV pilus assembly protein PilV